MTDEEKIVSSIPFAGRPVSRIPTKTYRRKEPSSSSSVNSTNVITSSARKASAFKSTRSHSPRNNVATSSPFSEDSKTTIRDTNTVTTSPSEDSKNSITSAAQKARAFKSQQQIRYVTTSPSDESEGSSFLYPDQKRNSRSLVSKLSEDNSVGSSSAVRSNATKNSTSSNQNLSSRKLTLVRHNRSLTVDPSDDDMGSVGSASTKGTISSTKKDENISTTKQEPQQNNYRRSRFTKRSDLGRSLSRTRTPSEDSKASAPSKVVRPPSYTSKPLPKLPTRSSSSSNLQEKGKKQEVATTTTTNNNNKDNDDKKTPSTSQFLASRRRTRSLSRTRFSISSKKSQSEECSDLGKGTVSKAAAATGRSPFSQIMADKLAGVKRVPSNSKLSVLSLATPASLLSLSGSTNNTSSSKPSGSPPTQDVIQPRLQKPIHNRIQEPDEGNQSEEKEKVTVDNNEVNETKNEQLKTDVSEGDALPNPDNSVSIKTADTDAETIPVVEDKSSTVDKNSNDNDVETMPVVEDKSSTLEENSKEVIDMSQKNVEKHTGVYDEYGDPPLEEIESEVSVGGFNMGSINDYLPSGDFIASLCTSPTNKEVESEFSNKSSFGIDCGDEHVDEKKEEKTENNRDSLVGTIEEKKEIDVKSIAMSVELPVENSSWDLSAARFSNIEAASSNTSQPDVVDMFDTTSWVAGTDAEFSNISLSKLAANEDSEIQFVSLMTEEKKSLNRTEDEEKMLDNAEKNLTETERKDEVVDEQKKSSLDVSTKEQIVFPSDDEATVHTSGQISSLQFQGSKKSFSPYGDRDPSLEDDLQNKIDMFDTSSWAAGTEPGFSETSLSKLVIDIDAENHFVKMMMEEMETRALTEDERCQMFEAREKIAQAEEHMRAESNIVQKDDEPLIGEVSNSNSDEGTTANDSVSLEDRLKMYAFVEPDEDSVDDDSEVTNQEEKENFDDEEIETNVEYIGQNSDDEDEDEGEINTNETEVISPPEVEEGIVPSKNVPTLEVAALAASTSSAHQNSDDDADVSEMIVEHDQNTGNDEEVKEERKTNEAEATSPPVESLIPISSKDAQPDVVVPATLESLKMAIPPPPPPGAPTRRKTKKNKSKSSSRDKNVPLLSPPPAEKVKKWEDDQKRARDYIASMKESLVKAEPKALEVSSEYFHFDSAQLGSNDETFEIENKMKESNDGIEVPRCDSSSIQDGNKSVPINTTTDVDGGRPETEENYMIKQYEETQVSDENEIFSIGDEYPAFCETKEDVFRAQVHQDSEGFAEVEVSSKENATCVDINQEVSHIEDQVSPLSGALVKEVDKHDNHCKENELVQSVSSTSRTTSTIEDIRNNQGPEAVPENNLWRKEVADAIGLVERLEEQYDQGFPEIDSFVSPLSEEAKMDSSEDQGVDRSDIPHVGSNNTNENSDIIPGCQDNKELVGDKIINSFSGGIEEEVENDVANEVLYKTKTETSVASDCGTHIEEDCYIKVEALESPVHAQKEIESGLFSSPKSSATSSVKPGKGSNEKRNQPNSTETILSAYKMADKVAMASSAAAKTFDETFSPDRKSIDSCKTSASVEFEALSWFSRDVLKKELTVQETDIDLSEVARSLFETKDQFNCMSRYVADSVNEVSMEPKHSLHLCDSVVSPIEKTLSTATSAESSVESSVDDCSENKQRPILKPVILSEASLKLNNKVLAANFVSFVYMASKNTKIPSPFGDSNPFLAMIVASSFNKNTEETPKTMQELLFDQLDGKAELLVDFVFQVRGSCDAEMKALRKLVSVENPPVRTDKDLGRRFKVPENHPSPFEAGVLEMPRILVAVLSFLGDPVAICRMKTVNRLCGRVVAENEHMLMQDAVRTGGIDASIRPAFWMWISLEKCDICSREKQFSGNDELNGLELKGEEGKWHHVIQRDILRSFGNMPPHKSGARFQSDSIVTALVSWGHNRIMKRGVKGGGGKSISSPRWKCNEDYGDDADVSVKSEVSETPTDTVSDWGAVSPKGSFVGNDSEYPQENQISASIDISDEDIALSGNSLSVHVKKDLQNKLSFILHSLAATYEDIGYCQGMDYIVAHLLRILQDTIRLNAANKTLPSVITTASTYQTSLPVNDDNIEAIYNEIDSNHIVEETIVRVMDVFFVNYNLKHMYFPELRCLKTCCRVFERLVQIKLPVLFDHFEHHDLNVGLFALGWFQTLFLYLPSMPSATVCHMWDIWLVERSFKIFFRVGTALLFLSQPTLLNHELEGMMIYLNTIPDATLLRPDILIPCALDIKVTNRMLQELEDEVMKNPN
ncbi:MAG: hypothetical protein ACI90V_006671 [Bacillariaceae sp.]|jgi:hypothetical protein